MRKTHWTAALLACALLALGCGLRRRRRRRAAAGPPDDDRGRPATAAARQIKVGLVSDVGKFNDRSFNQSALEGLQAGRRPSSASRDGRSSRGRPRDYIPNLSSLARQDYDLTIGVGFLIADAINTAAEAFPDQNFAIIDFSVKAPPFKNNPATSQGLTFATNENSYMIGCLAAKMAEQQGGKQVISVVGGQQAPDRRHLHRRLPGGREEVPSRTSRS